MQKPTKTAGVLTAVIGVITTAILVGTSENIEVGDSRIVNQTPSQEIVVTKTTAENREVRVFKKQFDQKTGQETNAVVYTFNTDSLNSDVTGKQNDIIKIQARIAEITSLIQGASGSGITITTPQYDQDTGERTEDLQEYLKLEDLQTQKSSMEEAIVQVNLQIDELNALISEADKIK